MLEQKDAPNSVKPLVPYWLKPTPCPQPLPVNVKVTLEYALIALLVAGPTTPSAESPFDDWNFLTAAVVLAPGAPSIGPGS